MKSTFASLICVVLLLGLVAGAEAYNIIYDGKGGDCTLIGTWTKRTKTCTITTDLNQGINILSDGIVLNGNNHVITGTGNHQWTGVYLIGRTGTIVKNFTINNFMEGIRLENSNGNTFANNNLSDNGFGIALFSSSNNSISNSVCSNNGTAGAYLYGASGNIFSGNNLSYNPSNIRLVYSSMNNFITNNTITGTVNSFGIDLYTECNSNEIRNNMISGNYEGLHISQSGYNLIVNNTIANNANGLVCSATAFNEIYNNNFMDNGVQIVGGGDTYNKPEPVGGNYWSNYDTPVEGCNDLNSDNFCDTPYYFDGGADNLPWTIQNGWND